MTFILAEDAAIKNYLQGLTVSDEKAPTRPVKVWFGYPDIEVTTQTYPYIIEKDLHGQRIIPENLGYVPLDNNIENSRKVVRELLANSRKIEEVRDGIAGVFFHPFLKLDLLKELADSLKDAGVNFFDLRKQTNWVKGKDNVILTGSQAYKMNLNNSYLYEVYYDTDADILKKAFSPERVVGEISKDIKLNPGEFY
ncbi:MAG: hypothetical protein WCH62_08230, partial [Candidatus Omnitrophota bacterium]